MRGDRGSLARADAAGTLVSGGAPPGGAALVEAGRSLAGQACPGRARGLAAVHGSATFCRLPEPPHVTSAGEGGTMEACRSRRPSIAWSAAAAKLGKAIAREAARAEKDRRRQRGIRS